MKTGWLQDGDKWYYLTDSSKVNPKNIDIQHGLGAMKTDWFKDNDKVYYFNESGEMQTGWIKDSGKDYCLYSDGSMIHDCDLYGWRFSSNGSAIKIQ